MGMKECGWHHWGVTRCAGDTMGQKSMDCAAKVISMTAAELMCNPDIVAHAQEEWRERMEGKVYKSLLADEMQPPVHLNEDVMKRYR